MNISNGLPHWNEYIDKDTGEIHTCGYANPGETSWQGTGLHINNTDVFKTGSLKNPITDDFCYITENKILQNFTQSFRDEANNLVISLEDAEQDTGDELRHYEFLERIDHVKKMKPDRKHKSNLYSVELKDTGLNESIEQLPAKDAIQSSVKKVVRDVCEKIRPADTNLFKVELTGE